MTFDVSHYIDAPSRRKVRWPMFAVPISVASWFVAVMVFRGADELAMRAVMAAQIFIPLSIFAGVVFVASKISAAAVAYPERRGRIRVARRARDGQCVWCGYSLTGNQSGICPECGKPRLPPEMYPFPGPIGPQ